MLQMHPGGRRTLFATLLPMGDDDYFHRGHQWKACKCVFSPSYLHPYVFSKNLGSSLNGGEDLELRVEGESDSCEVL